MTRLLWRVLLLVVIVAPVPFGGFRPWAWSAIGLVMALAGAAWMALLLCRQMKLFWRASFAAPAVALAAVAGWIVMQGYWPATGAAAHPIWQMAGQTLGVPLAGHISATPAAGAVQLLRLLTAAMAFWLFLQFCRERAHALQFLHWFGIASAVYALYGLVNLIAGNRYLLFYRRWAYLEDVTGTFVNRNTYATFAGLGLLVLSTLFTDTYRRRLRESDPTLSPLGRRQAALAGWPALYLTGAVVVAMALLQSHSRMGLVASVSGFAALLLLLRASGSIRGWVPIVVAAGLGIFVYGASGSGVEERIASAGGSDRAALIATTRRAIDSSPLLGSGYGSFPDVFPMYRDTTLPAPATYEMAHNTYLELPMELGVPATVALILAVGWMAVVALTGVFRRERDRSLPALAVAATVLIAVHALLDFSVQITAVQLTYMALLAMGVAQAFASGDRPLSAPRKDEDANADADGVEHG